MRSKARKKRNQKTQIKRNTNRVQHELHCNNKVTATKRKARIQDALQPKQRF